MGIETNFDVSNIIPFGAEIAFYVLLLIFTIHAIFLSYHWFSYGTHKRYGQIALAVYLIGGAIFFLLLAMLLGKL